MAAVLAAVMIVVAIVVATDDIAIATTIPSG